MCNTSWNTAFFCFKPGTPSWMHWTTALTNDAYQNTTKGETSLDNTEPFNPAPWSLATVNGLGPNEGLLTTQSLFQSGVVTWDKGTWVSHFSDGEHINRAVCQRSHLLLV